MVLNLQASAENWEVSPMTIHRTPTDHYESLAVYSPLDQSARHLTPPLGELYRASGDRKVWFSKSADN